MRPNKLKYISIFLVIFTEILYSATPAIKPMKNSFYKDFPSDIYIKVNLFNENIKSLTHNERELSYLTKNYPYQRDAVIIELPKNELLNLPNGEQIININFVNGLKINFILSIYEKRDNADLTIIAPYVGHGSSVLFILPNKKVLLVDSGKKEIRDSIIIPLLKQNGITKIDYFIITHYHDDHDSGDKGRKIKSMFLVENFYDYKSFSTGDTFDISGVNFKILNSYKDGDDENSRSLSFKMQYKGFVYTHGADTYGINQQRIMKEFPADIEADVFYANHHFYGSIDINYLRAVNPHLVLLQIHEAMYENRAYLDYFKNGVEKYLLDNKKRYIEDLPTLEVGTVVIRVNSKDDWHYETYGNIVNNLDIKLF